MSFDKTVDNLFKGMETFINSKTVVGECVKLEDGTLVLPFVEAHFTMGAGDFNNDKKDKTMGAMGGKIIPSAAIVIKNDNMKLINIKNQDTVTKILDYVPEIIDKFK